MERQQKIVVIDASVATKWFVEEEFTEQALKIVDDYERRLIDLRSTQLLPFEVLNALRYNPEAGETEIEKAAEALARFKIALYPLLGDFVAQCVRAALKYGLTIYDASYLSLGRLLNCDLYTADEKFIAKARGEKTVRHIRSYPGWREPM